MIDTDHFREHVIRPTLRRLEPHIPYSEAAEELLLGTAVQESRLKYLRQIGGGPARGVYQIEPATHKDIYENYLRYEAKRGLRAKVRSMAGIPKGDIPWWRQPSTDQMHRQLAGNMIYATVIARIKYYRDSEPLPEAGDIEAMGEYYKRVFNTAGGDGTAAEWVQNYTTHVLKH